MDMQRIIQALKATVAAGTGTLNRSTLSMRGGGRTKKNPRPHWSQEGAVTIGEYSSLRKRMRAVNRGITSAAQPTKTELQRYPWYRRKVAAASLRIQVAQEQPGDRALVA